MDRRSFIKATIVPAALTGVASLVAGRAQGALGPKVVRGAPLLPLLAGDLTSIAQRPTRFLNVFSQLAPNGDPNVFVRQRLGAPFLTLENAGCAGVFATLVAFNMAPYGDPGIPPLTATLGQLMQAPLMSCGHYCKLTYMLSALAHSSLAPPDSESWEAYRPTMHFIVWNTNSPLNVGTHLQIIVTDALDASFLLLDPTYCFVMRIPNAAGSMPASGMVPESVAASLQQPVPADHLVVLDDAPVDDGGTFTGRASVIQALTGGVLRPSDVYYDPSFGSDGWETAMSGVLERMG
jgi:hypothetical protein